MSQETRHVTRLEVDADPSRAIRAAAEAKKAWLEVDQLTKNLGRGNVFGGQTVTGVGAPVGTAAPVNAPGASTTGPGGPGGPGAAPWGLRPGGAPGGATVGPAGPAYAPGTVLGPNGMPVAGAITPGSATVSGSAPPPAAPLPPGSSTAPPQPPAGGGPPRGSSLWTDLDVAGYANQNRESGGHWSPRAMAAAFHSASMAIRGGVAGPELAGLGVLGYGFNAWGARHKSGSWQNLLGSTLGTAIPVIGSVVGQGADIAVQRNSELADIEAQMGLAELNGARTSARDLSPGQVRQLAQLRALPAAQQTPEVKGMIRYLERDVLRDLGRQGQRSGYTPAELAQMNAAYTSARGFDPGAAGDLTAGGLDVFARLGLDTSTAARYSGLRGASVGATGGNYGTAAGLAWTQGLRGDRANEYLAQIVAHTEQMAARGVQVDQDALERFIGRMQATPELANTGKRQVAAADALGSLATRVSDEVLAPYGVIATARVRHAAFKQPGGRLGAAEWLNAGDPWSKVNDAIGQDDIGTGARMALTPYKTRAQARAFGHLAADPAAGALPAIDQIPGLDKHRQRAEGESWIYGLITPALSKLMRDRTYSAQVTAFEFFDGAVGVLDGGASSMEAAAQQLLDAAQQIREGANGLRKRPTGVPGAASAFDLPGGGIR